MASPSWQMATLRPRSDTLFPTHTGKASDGSRNMKAYEKRKSIEALCQHGAALPSCIIILMTSSLTHIFGREVNILSFRMVAFALLITGSTAASH